MDLLRELAHDQNQINQLFRRAAFNVMLGNDDDHGKNHSFLMDGDGVWSLAPAYDIVQGAHPLGGGTRACGVAGRLAEVRREDLLALAETHSVAKPAETIDEIREVLSRIKEFAEKTGMSERRADELAQGLRLV
jgi:serine/threonine-protein kinase HipA